MGFFEFASEHPIVALMLVSFVSFYTSITLIRLVRGYPPPDSED